VRCRVYIISLARIFFSFRSKYGQFIGKQLFKHPVTGKEEEYVFHGEGDGVRVLGLTDDKKVIAIREYQHAVDEIIVQLPPGGTKEKEKPQKAARRELLEETGYRAAKIIDLGYGRTYFLWKSHLPLSKFNRMKKKDLKNLEEIFEKFR